MTIATTTDTKAYVIMCNDWPQSVYVGSEKAATQRMEIAAQAEFFRQKTDWEHSWKQFGSMYADAYRYYRSRVSWRVCSVSAVVAISITVGE